MLATQPDLELLTAILVLLWPLRVVFPGKSQRFTLRPHQMNLPQDLTLFDNTLDLSNKGIADAHCKVLVIEPRVMRSTHTLFTDERVIAVVGVVGVSRRSTTAISQHPEIELLRLSANTPPLCDSRITHPETRVQIALGDRSCITISSAYVRLRTAQPTSIASRMAHCSSWRLTCEQMRRRSIFSVRW